MIFFFLCNYEWFECVFIEGFVLKLIFVVKYFYFKVSYFLEELKKK